MYDYADMSLLEGIEKFFFQIKQKCFDKEEYAAEILKARGFLLEDDKLILSDNSHRDDAGYLNELLTRENIGEVQDNKIIIFPNANVEKIFYSSYIGGSESFLAYSITWERFLHEDFAPKVPVSLLERFIARYVKAISACGVQTHGSCDGNHYGNKRGFSKIIVEISGHPDLVWYDLIFKRCLAERFESLKNCVTDRDSSTITFNKIKKWKFYTELNQAAEFLYNNRIKLRQIRREALSEISHSMTIHLPYDELAKIFSDKANSLFDDILVTI